jgi:mono/diheme cytochrome c family protein
MNNRALMAVFCAAVGIGLQSVKLAFAEGTSDAASIVQTAPYSSLDDVAGATTEMEKGKHLFSYWCSSCHGSGHDHPGTAALEKKYQGKFSALLEERTDLTPNLTRYYVRTGATPMPFFRKTEISDSELDAIADYLARNIPAPSK